MRKKHFMAENDALKGRMLVFHARAANTPLIFSPQTLQLTQGWLSYHTIAVGKKGKNSQNMLFKKPFFPLFHSLFKKDENNLFYLQK